jgi:polysaccharide chain length determinant protein (PEP-CTERM system associated)
MNLQPLTDSPLEQLPTIVAEARARRVAMVVVFAIVALTALGIGAIWPKKYVSSTTILVQEDNIIQPLMEGRAVATSVTDRARIAREVVFGRRIMQSALENAGLLADNPSPIERERLAENVKAATQVTNAGENLIRIAYTDSDPERALSIARTFAEMFMEESLANKERESREAYEFIAARVEEYHTKLTTAEERLKRYRAENLDARPGTEADVNARITQLRGAIESARTSFSELQMRERAIQQQLAGEAEVADSQNRETQNRIRIAELKSELARLLLSYTDEYPDVVRLRHQIEDLEREADAEASRRAASQVEGGDGASESRVVVVNPLYVQLRGDLARVRGDMAAFRARIDDNEALLQGELDRGRRVADSEASLAELTRDYEVNRDIYQDLLRRRENARVSMSLDAEKRGLTFKIQEPAALPLQPTGLRFLHFALAGAGLGAAIPIALLFALLRFDPRVRSAAVLSKEISVPILVSVPVYANGRLRRTERIRTAASVAILLLVAAAFAVLGWMRLSHVI